MKNKLTIGIQLIDDPGWIGGTLYLRNLVICLARLSKGDRPNVKLMGNPEVILNFRNDWAHLSIFQSSLTERIFRYLGFKQTGNDIDVVYPGFGISIPGAVTIQWVPDFQHRYLPYLFSTEEIRQRERTIKEIAERPEMVVFSSNVAADDFRLFYPDHLAIPRIWHFYSVIDTLHRPVREILKKYILPDKYLYIPNHFWVHKNHITVLKALAILREKHDMIIPLVCTGTMNDRRNEGHISDILHFINLHGMSNQIHMLGLIDRNQQIEVFRHAAAIVQPSLFEGWSTVVEDTRAIGRPIFLSDIPVHREQSPERSLFFPPESAEDLAFLLLDNWEMLSPGPDLFAEQQARQKIDNLLLESGRIFCNIAMEAVLSTRKSV